MKQNTPIRQLSFWQGKYGKPCFGGSDSHKEEYVGMAFTEFDREITCNNDLIACVKEGESRLSAVQKENFSASTKNVILLPRPGFQSLQPQSGRAIYPLPAFSYPETALAPAIIVL